jgi:DNA-binding IclR family transcriptional regulator
MATMWRRGSLKPGLIVEDDRGMGAAVFDGTGMPRWTLNLTGVEPRFRPGRQEELGQALLTAAHELTRAIQRTGRRSYL